MANRTRDERDDRDQRDDRRDDRDTRDNGDKKTPVMKFGPYYAGSCYISAAVWQNEIEGDKSNYTVHSVTLTRRYKNRKGDYVDGGAFRTSEIPYAVAALQQAFNAIVNLEAER